MTDIPTSYWCGHCKATKLAKEFPPSKAKAPSQWCRQCLREDKRKREDLAAVERSTKCDHCGEVFATTYSKARFCSRACKTNYRNAASSASREASKPDRSCRWCGEPMAKRLRSDAVFCSVKCNEQAHRRTRNYRRRGVGGVKPRKQPLVNLAALAARDGHGCALCGKRVDIKRSHPHPMSASVDHIVPLAHGGDPLEPTNCRVVHLVCNLSRQHRGDPEQLRLIG